MSDRLLWYFDAFYHGAWITGAWWLGYWWARRTPRRRPAVAGPDAPDIIPFARTARRAQ
jgi:hypothetical protein